MLVIFIKSLITFVLVVFFIRLMGKRQIGEMQPIELVITLIISEVVCIPMNDPTIPLIAGIIPILTLSVIEIIFMFLSRKSLFFRKLLSGTAIVIIDKDGINLPNMKKMNMNMNDLLESLRSSGYGDLSKVKYAIFETNGKLFVALKPNAADDGLLPMPILIDGKIVKDNFKRAGADMIQFKKVFTDKGYLQLKDILFVDVRQNGMLYISPKYEKDFTAHINIKGGNNW